MHGLFDSISVRMSASIVAACVVLAVYFSLDIYQFVTRRNFTNLNVYLVHFTRHDHNAKDDKVTFQLMGYNIPLRDICRNRYLFWMIFYRSLKTSKENPVLYFGERQHALNPVRGRVSEIWRGMLIKRAAGLPFRELECKLALVYDPSEENSHFVMRIILIQNRDIRQYDEYAKQPPINSRNFEFVGRIVRAYRENLGTFVDVRITAA